MTIRIYWDDILLYTELRSVDVFVWSSRANEHALYISRITSIHFISSSDDNPISTRALLATTANWLHLQIVSPFPRWPRCGKSFCRSANRRLMWRYLTAARKKILDGSWDSPCSAALHIQSLNSDDSEYRCPYQFKFGCSVVGRTTRSQARRMPIAQAWRPIRVPGAWQRGCLGACADTA